MTMAWEVVTVMGAEDDANFAVAHLPEIELPAGGVLVHW